MSGGWWGGCGPKAQFLRQLHNRVGHPFPFSFDEPFRFETRGVRWQNIDQLEAVVEFYANFDEPWGGGAPRKPGEPGYVTVSLRDPQGDSAKIAPAPGTVVTLDGQPNLSEVIPNPALNPVLPVAAVAGYAAQQKFLYDTLWLESDTGRRGSHTYRIMAVDDQAKTVTLDARPTCPGDTSKWRINRRPSIVVIDPLGPRVRAGIVLRGNAATVARIDPLDATRTILRLDPAVPLDRINTGFDTIYLASDTVRTVTRPGPTYRVVAVDAAAHEITVVGAPSLGGGVSRWEIPAGVGGEGVPRAYNLGWHVLAPPPPAARRARGFDHYDAALFLVRRGVIEGRRAFRWSTYTSRDQGTWGAVGWQELLSSLRGNARYYYAGLTSDNHFKNFTFAVVDAQPGRGGFQRVPADSVASARFYFGTPSPPAPPQANADALDPRVLRDANGKTLIRIHRGSHTAAGSGSAGCVVSPDYFDMRTDLGRLYERDYAEYYGPGTFDTEVRKLVNATTEVASTALWNPGGLPPNHLDDADWRNKLVGGMWVIRPDERPAA
jgi:hypothetical protein